MSWYWQKSKPRSQWSTKIPPKSVNDRSDLFDKTWICDFVVGSWMFARSNTHHLAELLCMPCVLSTCALGFYWHLHSTDASFLVCDYKRTILSKFQCHTTMLRPWKRFAFQTLCAPLPPLTCVLFYDSTCRKQEGAKANCLVSSSQSVLWFLLVCRMYVA